MMWSEAIRVLLTHAKWRNFTQRPFPAPDTAGQSGEPGVAIGHVLGMLALYGISAKLQKPDGAPAPDA